MRELTFNEIEAVSGAEVTRGGIVASAISGAAVGGATGALVGGIGAGPGALAGAITTVAGYMLFETIKDMLD
ncbi:hypothetical protein GCM10027431_20410 [Lysobacter rhizosphaerae]